MSVSTPVGERIRDARESAGFVNRNEFARQTHIEPHTLYRYESGIVKTPPALALAEIARRTGVRLEWLVTGQGPRERVAQADREVA